jgi:curved DNA-binding protein CbpA
LGHPDQEGVTAMQRDYYLVLGVSQDETARGIHDAYRQLVKKHHPDHAGPEEAQAFRDVVEAYEMLSDAEKRRRYTQGLRRAEGRLDVAPDTIVFSADAPAEPLAPDPSPAAHPHRPLGVAVARLSVPSRQLGERNAFAGGSPQEYDA